MSDVTRLGSGSPYEDAFGFAVLTAPVLLLIFASNR